MNDRVMFTNTVNYRCVASQLRKDGYTAVPDIDELLASARKAGPDLGRWVQAQLDRNAGDFHGALAFHLTDVGDGT